VAKYMSKFFHHLVSRN